ncbi:MAG TPA: GNAT family N-acetyltransferase [Bryobacteraceae bacterium]|nr:GNAT family N-acetyltransferase [Bryobacteraceae bacterium]
MPTVSAPRVTVRTATPDDAAVCGRICYEAFCRINSSHNFPSDFSSPERPVSLISLLFARPDYYCVVAEADGRLIGSNCLDQRSLIYGIGPITVDPAAQNLGAGRMMMEAAIARARERGAAGIRLVQAAFHNRSLALYTSLGFDAREPLSCLQGRTVQRSIPGCTVRPAEPRDLEDCNNVSRRVHGFARGVELAESIDRRIAVVVERDSRITGYASSLAFFGHAAADSNPDMQALIASAESFGGSGILVPTRNAQLMRWCLANGLRIVQPMTLMTMGLYNEPAGSWFSSILF